MQLSSPDTVGRVESAIPAPSTPEVAASRFPTAYTWGARVVVGILLALVGVFSRPTVSFETPTHTVYTLIVVGCCAAVAVARRLPRTALVAIALLLALHLLIVPEPGVFALAMCVVAIYTAQTRTSPVERWIFTALVMLGAVAGVADATAVLDGDWRTRIIAGIAVIAVLAIAVLVGIVRRQARHRYTAALERAAALEAQQHTEQRLVAVEERTRIAREMHDILGHSLNAIAMQAEGARHALRAAPEQAETALADIGRLSRAAVDEVRDLIDVLHTGNEPATTRPTPSLADIPELIRTFPRANIRLNTTGDPCEVQARIALSGYRIVQEALTNAVKHAPDAVVIVGITISERTVELTVANGPSLLTLAAPQGGGHGLIGMRERARALGGTINAGPDPATGGWKVTARLPRSRA